MKRYLICKQAGHLIAEIPCVRNRAVRRGLEKAFCDWSVLFYPSTALVFECPADAQDVLQYTDEAEALARVHKLADSNK